MTLQFRSGAAFGDALALSRQLGSVCVSGLWGVVPEEVPAGQPWQIARSCAARMLGVWSGVPAEENARCSHAAAYRRASRLPQLRRRLPNKVRIDSASANSSQHTAAGSCEKRFVNGDQQQSKPPGEPDRSTFTRDGRGAAFHEARAPAIRDDSNHPRATARTKLPNHHDGTER